MTVILNKNMHFMVYIHNLKKIKFQKFKVLKSIKKLETFLNQITTLCAYS